MMLLSSPFLVGCGSSKVATPSPEAIAAAVVETFDANRDGVLDKEEMAKCPPIASSVAMVDRDGDNGLSAAEIAVPLQRLKNSSPAEMTCTVKLDGRPLEGAQVLLRPLEAFGAALPSATGSTDSAGLAHPSIPTEQLDTELRDLRFVYPGLYHVEITHPSKKLPARYNTATELGCEVDPSSRAGASANFDLKSK